MTSKNIAKSVILVNIFSAAGFFLTLLFQIIFAKEFGVSGLTDAYIGACALPVSFVAIASSLLEKTFIPVFFEYKNRAADARYSIHNFFTIYFIFLVFLSVVCFAASPFIIRLVLPGFEAVGFSMALAMLKMLLPIFILGGLIGLLTSMHYAHSAFIFPNVCSSVKWITAIIFMLYFKGRYGIFAVAGGIVAGYTFQFLMLLYSTFKNITGLRFIFNLKDVFLRKVVMLMGPLMIANAFNTFNIIVMTRTASVMSAGSITCLDYAYKIMTISVFLCVQGISVVLFPMFSRLASEGNISKLKKLFTDSQRILLMIVMPIIGGLIIFRHPVIRLLLERGEFGPESTNKISALVFGFSGAFFGLALGTIQSQIYYAIKNTKRVMFITFIQMVVFVCMIFMLRSVMSIYIIAIFFSAAIFIGCCLNYFHINKILGIRAMRQDAVFIFKILIATVSMGAVGFVAFSLLKAHLPLVFVPFVAASMLSAAVYFIFIRYVFDIDELRFASNVLFSKKYE
ncbi:MAG: hypothetical protein COS29_01105 [Candidatus Omnitrophica bacterium CG02_land_8_20_14_3_00__42_8]|nr:MAG: hypothetical protein COS29_01105 [Candidatus Omnitrophica bacterium CG02_land_8_20_14_3_00__42_8]